MVVISRNSFVIRLKHAVKSADVLRWLEARQDDGRVYRRTLARRLQLPRGPTPPPKAPSQPSPSTGAPEAASRGYALTLHSSRQRFDQVVADLSFRLLGSLRKTQATPLCADRADKTALLALDSGSASLWFGKLPYVGNVQDVELLLQKAPSCCAHAPWSLAQLEVQCLTSGTVYLFSVAQPHSGNELRRLLLQHPRARVVTPKQIRSNKNRGQEEGQEDELAGTHGCCC